MTNQLDSNPAEKTLHLQREDGTTVEYTVTGRRAKAGQSKVFTALSPDGVEVILKQYKEEDLMDQDDPQKVTEGGFREIAFLQKAKEHGRKDVPEFVDAGFRADNSYDQPLVLVTKPVSWRNLDEIIAHPGHNPAVEQILNLARGLGETLKYAHTGAGVNPVINRDLKSSNIIIKEDGSPVIVDWGGSKFGSGETLVNTQFLSLYYTAPEVAEGRTVGTFTDVYGLGQVLKAYGLGKKEFEAFDGKPEKQNFVNQNIAPHVIDALFKATEEEPAKRYQSIDEFVNALEGRRGLVKVDEKGKLLSAVLNILSLGFYSRNKKRQRQLEQEIKSSQPQLAKHREIEPTPSLPEKRNNEPRIYIERGLLGKARIVSSTPILLDESPANEGNKKTQDNWFTYWNTIDDGRVMASMGDLYQAFKELKGNYEQGTPEEKTQAQRLLKSLRDDFDWPGKNNWLITATRLTYKPNILEGMITQHYQCHKPELTKETSLVIPEYRGAPLAQVADDVAGLLYLQVLHDTHDDGETIMQTLEFVSEKDRNNIKVWTAAVNGDYTRREYSERAAGFDCGNDSFHGDGDLILIIHGRSRGVLR